MIDEAARRMEASATLTLVCEGQEAGVAAFAEDLAHVSEVVVDEEGLTAADWRVFRSPFAVALDQNGTVIGVLEKLELNGVRLLAMSAASNDSRKMG